MPLALTTLFGNVKLLSNFCILQNILDRFRYEDPFVVFQCACNSCMESYFCSCRGIFILFIEKTMYLEEVLQKQTAIFLVLIIYMHL